MKTLLTFLVGMAIFACTQAQVPTVPRSAQDRFNRLYPNQSGVTWNSGLNDSYEASFLKDGRETMVTFDRTGRHTSTSTQVETEALPMSARTYISNNVPGQITRTHRVAGTDGIVRYEATVGGTDYIFDSQGRYLRKAIRVRDRNDHDLNLERDMREEKKMR